MLENEGVPGAALGGVVASSAVATERAAEASPPRPDAFAARTRYQYVVPAVRPESDWLVAVRPLATIVQVPAELVDRSSA